MILTEAQLAGIADLPRSLVIPTVVGVPHYKFRTRLDGREFNLRFAWNERDARWYFDIATAAEEPLAVGLKVVCAVPLLRYYQFDRRLPQGEIVAIDLSGDESPPGLYELGIDQRVRLIYFPVTEL